MTWWMTSSSANLGAAAEPIVAAEFALSGYQVYRSLTKDHGVELLIDRGDGHHLLVRVKSIRSGQYVFVTKDSFPLDDHRALALLVFPYDAERPELFVIPAAAWRAPEPPLFSRDYDGLKSKPEWGVSISKNAWRVQLARWRMMPGHPLPTDF